MSILETSTQGHAVPSFSIFLPFSNETVPTLKHCFLKNMTLDRADLPAQILADDGLVYTTVYDSRFPENLNKFPVVISFQQHTYGRFAVIRIDSKKFKRT